MLLNSPELQLPRWRKADSKKEKKEKKDKDKKDKKDKKDADMGIWINLQICT